MRSFWKYSIPLFILALIAYSWLDRPRDTGQTITGKITSCVPFAGYAGRTLAAGKTRQWCTIHVEAGRDAALEMPAGTKEGAAVTLTVSERPDTGQRYYTLVKYVAPPTLVASPQTP